MKSKSISRPRGRPERIATSAFPCDSPAVIKSNITSNISPEFRLPKVFFLGGHDAYLPALSEIVGGNFGSSIWTGAGSFTSRTQVETKKSDGKYQYPAESSFIRDYSMAGGRIIEV